MIRPHPFVASVEAALRGHCDVRPGERLVVAVSGGADSIALLGALHAIADRPNGGLELHVAHVHHHLRPEADADADLVAEAAGALDLPFHRRDVTIEPGRNVEAEARRLRYAALAEVARACRASAVATAHHADDQLETVLMRLIRGASIRGLAGMADRSRVAGVVVVRPMIEVDHAAAVDYCRAMGLRWREDASNADRQRWRARLRAEVLPALKDLRHDAGIKAVEAGRQLRQAAAVIDRRIRAIAEDVVADEGTSRWLNRVDARAISQGELTALLRREAVALSVPADRLPARLLNEIASAARSNSGETRRFELARGGRIVVDAEHLTVHGPDDADGA